MLGSDPVAALLGAGTDPRSPKRVWRTYLRALVNQGVAITMLGPDVIVPEGADDATVAVLAELAATYPVGSQMPAETTGALKDTGLVATDGKQCTARVDAYYKRIEKIGGKELTPTLLENGTVTPSAGLHVGVSGLVAVVCPDAEALAGWRAWAAETSGDPYERHTGPTLLQPGMPGGGVYLFRTDAATAAPAGLELEVAGCTLSSGDLVIPIPPSRIAGKPISRLGPARMLPVWLQRTLRDAASPIAV